jgi:amphi-Trp domain-containing protein
MGKPREYEAEATLAREDAAAYLEAIAAGLRRGSMRVRVERKAFTLEVPRKVDLELEIELDGDRIGLEVGLSWKGATSTKVPKLHVGPAEP